MLTEKVHVPVVRPIPENLLKDHYPMPFPKDPVTLEGITQYMDSLINVIENYREDKKALRKLATPEK